MNTLVETSVVYVCNFIDTDFVDNADSSPGSSTRRIESFDAAHCKLRFCMYKQLKISGYMRMPHRRLVPKTVGIKSNKTLDHSVCFSYFIGIVTSVLEGDQTTGEWRGLHNEELYDHYST